MTNQAVVPPTVHPPAGAYSHAVSMRGAGHTLYISGQIGLNADGALAEGFAGQAAQCWRNIVAILEAEGLTAHDLVKVTTYVVDPAAAADLGRIREPFLEGARPASTLVAVAALMRPDWLIEVEAIAFRAA